MEDQNPEEVPEHQTLDSFREQWKNELAGQTLDNMATMTLQEESLEDQAKRYFMAGADLEKAGKVFDATRLYRKAIQLVPDIEFKIYEMSKGQKAVEEVVSKEEGEAPKEDEVDDEDLSELDLIVRFEGLLMKVGQLCQRNTGNERMIVTGSNGHFGALPMEIILYIFRWVVSNDLDVRSLDTCSQVCRGFYICARDSELWRAACVKVWGLRVGGLDGSPYATWRDMFYLRHRVLFSGCYISKTSYLRMGENNFQDHFYAPIHLVQYYRLIRFFADGSVVMLTSAEDPQQSVAKLRNRFVGDSTLHQGHFRLTNDIVYIVLKQRQVGRRPQNKRQATVEKPETTFYIELKIGNSAKRKFCKLEWSHYAVTRVVNNVEVDSEFELNASRFPPFWFSRVKSYHSEADAAL